MRCRAAAYQSAEAGPQGLKPAFFAALSGAAEAAPFQNKVKTRVKTWQAMENCRSLAARSVASLLRVCSG